MRFTVLVIACVALLATSAVLYAGPFSAVPTIEVSGNEFGAESLVQKDLGGHINVGYARFSFKNILPTVTAPGTVLLAGGSQSQDAGGLMLSGEAFKMIDAKSGSMFRLGAWYAAPTEAGGSQWAENVGEVHLGYRFNQYIGVEVGQFIGDGVDAFGKNSAYLTYEIPPTPDTDVAFMFGAGTITKTNTFAMTGVPNVERSTDISAFVNATYGMQNDLTLNVGVWFLRQKLSIPAFSYISSSGPIAIDSTTGHENSVNWCLSIGKKF